MFQDGSFKTISSTSCQIASLDPHSRIHQVYNTARRQLHSLAVIRPHESMLTWSQNSTQPTSGQLKSRGHDWFQTFPFQQFHVLFNSLFRVLFIFPSRYLFAIGLSPVFSFRWNIPPNLGCIPKQPDSLRAYHMRNRTKSETGFSPSMIPCSKGLWPGRRVENASINYNSPERDFKFELFPLHSPLLGESLLVSFPPLINMLKFSG